MQKQSNPTKQIKPGNQRGVCRGSVFSLDAGRRALVKYFNKSQSEALPASCFWMKILRKRMETIVSSGARTEHLIVLIGQ